MTEREEWGPWIEHDGKGCPVEIGKMVEVVICARWLHDGQLVPELNRREGPLPCEDWEAWYGGPVSDDCGFITRYRVKKPRALHQLRAIAKEPEVELV